MIAMMRRGMRASVTRRAHAKWRVSLFASPFSCQARRALIRVAQDSPVAMRRQSEFASPDAADAHRR